MASVRFRLRFENPRRTDDEHSKNIGKTLAASEQSGQPRDNEMSPISPDPAAYLQGCEVIDWQTPSVLQLATSMRKMAPLLRRSPALF